ncbi:MAG: Stp1/IreP family PP2C-type Ser/Thr phosphatase [Succiniclasticum sp.]|jgi:serine/threonine protein phosphatase PrpC
MSVVVRTHTGKVRENNEDSLLLLHPKLFAIADGMGGYNAGEVASVLSLYSLRDASPELENAAPEDLIPTLRRLVQQINRVIYQKAASVAEFNGMGTTLTGIYLDGAGKGYIFHVGDSRVYLLREGKLRQLTRDHSLVGELLEKGKITAEEAFDHPQKNMLTRAIGVNPEVDVDVFETSVFNGDLLLLCSDGLSDMLRDDQIRDILLRDDLETAADNLIKGALDAGGKDNISFILILVDGKKEPVMETAEIKTTGAVPAPDTKRTPGGKRMAPGSGADKADKGGAVTW